MQSYPQSMCQVKRESIKCTRCLEKIICWDSNRVPRGVETCAKPPTLPCHTVENVVLMVIPF